MKNLLLLVSFFALIFCYGQKTDSINQNIPVINHEELKTIFEKENDKLLVVNFWATWCVPCIEELPEFIEVNNLYKDNPNYKMILVSLDRAKSLNSVNKFISKKKINITTYLLSDSKSITLLEQAWSNAIPTTIIYKNGKKIFMKEEQMNKEELYELIKSNL